MDSIRKTKTFQKVIHLKKAKNNSKTERATAEEAKEELKNRAYMEAFAAKLFATLSSLKAAYAELQMAQFPYNNEAVQSTDQAVVDELKALSQLKHKFLKKQIDSSPPHVIFMLAELQEQQSFIKIYEITMKKMKDEVDKKEPQISSLQEKLKEINQTNRFLEKTMKASGCFSVLETVKFSDLNPKDFVLVYHYALRCIRNFVKFLIREMELANWDIEAAAKAIQPDIMFTKRDHKAFAFESFVCREIFSGFNNPIFSMESLPTENHQRRIFFFEEFKKLRSVSVSHFIKQNAGTTLFGKFLKSKYLQFVHPKMEFSFSGNLNQRKTVNSGEYPETEFFKMFAEMGRRVWLLHCLAFSFDQEVQIFQVEQNSRFSEVYMESVVDNVYTAAAGDLRVGFTVVPGFKFRQTIVQSQVYLLPAKSPATS